MIEIRPSLIPPPETVKGEEGELLLLGLHYHYAGDRLKGLQLYKASLTHIQHLRKAGVGRSGRGRIPESQEEVTTLVAAVKEKNGHLLGP